MSRQVYCVKLKKNLDALEEPPYPGDLGKRIFESVSKQAWDLWMEYQTKLINELKLKMFQPEAQKIVREHAEKFFFEDKEATFDTETPK